MAQDFGYFSHELPYDPSFKRKKKKNPPKRSVPVSRKWSLQGQKVDIYNKILYV